ncbi:MAG: hypothetical protein WC384_22345 [Prolixibacteraceae bacterium]
MKNKQVQTPPKIIGTAPAAPQKLTPPPPPIQKSTVSGSTKTSIYNLISARVDIRTGSNNKEFPSMIGVMLASWGSNGGWIMQQLSENMRNEMKSNSNTEFGLEKMTNRKPNCSILPGADVHPFEGMEY